MTGLPTVQVLLDDGTGTYPTDISSRVELDQAVTVSSYGRTDELNAAQSAQLALVLDNTDGALTGGGGSGFDMLPFDSGPFGGVTIDLRPGLGIRVKVTKGATTRDRFTGRISGLNLGWPGGAQSFSLVGLTASDKLADLARRRMRSMLEEEILLRDPSVYYTLGEAEGSTSAGDTSGNQADPLTITGTGTALTFGTGAGPVDGLTAAQFFGGQFLTAGTGATVSRAAFGITATFATTTTPAAGLQAYFAYWGGTALYIDDTGHLRAGGAFFTTLDGGSVVDGHTTRAILATNLAGTTISLYVNGVLKDSSSISNASIFDITYVGGFPTSVSFPNVVSFTGTLSHFARWATAGLTASDVTAIDNAATGASETTSARFARLASYAGAATSTTTGQSGQLVGLQSTSGSSVLDALQAVATAEGGPMYANGSGTIVLQGRYYRSNKTAADLTLSSDNVGGDTVVTYDTQQVINKVTATRTDGAAQLVKDTASITANGVYETSLDLAVTQDSDALNAAQWLVASHADPSIRLAAATFDLQESTAPEPIMARDIGDRLSLTSMPSQMWSGAGDVTLEGWTESITHISWTLTANLLPYALFSSFVLDSATLGVLDSATPLNY